MNPSKRELIDNFSADRNSKKLRVSINIKETTSISRLEQLSNEIIYEIFEYLDGCDMFNAFSNLNNRFDNLLNDTSLRLRMSIDFKSISQFQDHCRRFILPNQHRIVSLRLLDSYYINLFLQLCNLNSSFSRLEALIFNYIKPDDVISLLPNLTQLPHLSCLIFYLANDFSISKEFYQLIFRLPSLKYSKLSTRTSLFQIPSSSFIERQISNIEHLIIDHPCDLNQLIAMLSCTPKLSYLTCKRMVLLDQPLQTENLITSSNLTHLFFHECRISFRDFEKFIKKASPQLKVLHMHTSSDSSYLDADRWADLILQCLPSLRTFNFEFHEFQRVSHGILVNKFTSPFWVDRRWICEIKVDMYQESTVKTTYCIHPYKQKWFKLCCSSMNDTHYDTVNSIEISDPKKLNSCSTQFSEGTELIVQGHGLVKSTPSFITNLDLTFPVIQITCLHISYYYPFSIDGLIELINLVPNTDALIISYVALRQLGNGSGRQFDAIRLASSRNRITRMRIGGLTNFDQLDILLNLCPQLQHFEIGHTDEIDRRLLIRSIMMRNLDQNPHMCSIFLWIPDVDEKFVKIFQRSTDLDKLLNDYKITCTHNGIHLQWDRHRLMALKKLTYMKLRNRKY